MLAADKMPQPYRLAVGVVGDMPEMFTFCFWTGRGIDGIIYL